MNSSPLCSCVGCCCTAIFYFWEKLGRRMALEDIPESLEEAYQVVADYVESDVNSVDTKEGRHLTSAITDMLCQYVLPTISLHSALPPLFPRFLPP